MTDAPERALGMAPNPFDEDMKGIADLTRSMFELEQEFDDDGALRLSELEKVLHLDKWLLQKRADAKHGVDQVRDEIRGQSRLRPAPLTCTELSRIARQQKEAATRPASVPSAEEAHARLAAIHAAKLVDLKFTTDEERNLNRLRGELERLKAELKVEEDEEVWQESELNSEVCVTASRLASLVLTALQAAAQDVPRLWLHARRGYRRDVQQGARP